MAFRTVIDGIGAITESSPGVFTTSGIIAEDVTSFPNDVLAGGCVAAGMEVTATSPATNAVTIAPGKAWVPNSAWVAGGDQQKFFPVNNDASVNITIPANGSGNPRIYLICVKIDTAPSPGDDGAPNCSYVVVQGTPAGAPVPPAVPSNHTVLAQIAVANGFSTITSGNITDRRLLPLIQLVLANDSALRAYDSTNTLRDVAKLDTNNDIIIGKDTEARHTVLQAGSSGLVKMRVRRTNAGTSIYENNTVIVTGWSFIAGDGSNQLRSTNGNFGITFSDRPVVVHSLLGLKSGSNPSHIGDFGFSTSPLGAPYVLSTIGTGSTSFGIWITTAASNWTSAIRLGVSYIAVGQLN